MNRIKKIVLLLIAQTAFLFSCKKETPRNNTAPQSMYDMLTKDTLVFQSYIFKWNTPLVDTFYQRKGNSNYYNLDTAWFKFDANGTYEANFSSSYNYFASWEFLDNGSKLRLWSDARNFDEELTLIRLATDTVEWVNPKFDNLYSLLLFK